MKSILLFCLLFLSQLSSALLLRQSNGDPSKAQDDVKKALTNLQVKNGDVDLLAIDVPSTPIEFSMEFIELQAMVENPVFSSDKGFRIIDVKLDNEEVENALEITTQLSNIEIKGNYNISGSVVNIVPIYGTGKFSIVIQSLTITIEAKMMETPEKGTSISKISSRLFDRDYKVSFSNFLGGGMLSMVTNKLMPLLGKFVFDGFQPQILQIFDQFFINGINEELRN